MNTRFRSLTKILYSKACCERAMAVSLPHEKRCGGENAHGLQSGLLWM